MVSATLLKLKVADAIWLAVAMRHKADPNRKSFKTKEITAAIRESWPEIRANTIAAHLHSHLVANVAPHGGHYRMLVRLEDGSLRLYRPGDPVAMGRSGKTMPNRSDVPVEYHFLLDWYHSEYGRNTSKRQEDPIKAMWGLGREIWSDTDADSYVNSLRYGWEPR
jgi:hypothetical protein